MSKFWVVFRREYAQVVKKKSFIVGLVMTPLLMGAFMVLPAVFARMKASSTEHLAVIDQTGSGVGQEFTASLDQYLLDDEETPYYAVDNVFDVTAGGQDRFEVIHDSLAQAVNDKELKYFLVIGPDAATTDSASYLVTNSDNFRSLNRFERRLSDLLASIRLTQSDINLSVDSVLSLTHPVDLSVRNTKGEVVPFQIKYFSAMIFVGIMFGMILGYGQLVMRSVIEEKNSRIMEVLISSVSPFQLMLGKIVGLGAATLTQVAIWFVCGIPIFSMRAMLDVDEAIMRIAFDPFIIGFFVLFLISGYLLYSALFALLGSVVNTEKEAQNFIAPITILMILPFVLGISVVQDPHSTLATTLSMIPFTAPTMMMMRVVFVVPTLTEYSFTSGIIGEAFLSLFLVIAAVLGMVWLTSKIFRIGILMYGKRPTFAEIMKWVKH